MKIAALIMFSAGTFFLWIAFQIQLLKRRPYVLRMTASFGKADSHFGAFAAYYLACAAAAIYFSALFYWDEASKFVGMPAICAVLVLWRQILIRQTKGNG
jgi:hypothetical protein